MGAGAGRKIMLLSAVVATLASFEGVEPTLKWKARHAREIRKFRPLRNGIFENFRLRRAFFGLGAFGASLQKPVASERNPVGPTGFREAWFRFEMSGERQRGKRGKRPRKCGCAAAVASARRGNATGYNLVY